MMTGAALMASTAMSNCWCRAASDISPGGRCGFQANQMSRSAARARTIQVPKSRCPCRGSRRDGRRLGRGLGRFRGRHELTTSISPIM